MDLNVNLTRKHDITVIGAQPHFLANPTERTIDVETILARVSNTEKSAPVFKGEIDTHFDLSVENDEARCEKVVEKFDWLIQEFDLGVIYSKRSVEYVDKTENYKIHDRMNYEFFSDMEENIVIEVRYQGRRLSSGNLAINNISIATHDEDALKTFFDTFASLATVVDYERPSTSEYSMVHFLVINDTGIYTNTKRLPPPVVHDEYYGIGVIDAVKTAINQEGPGFIYLSGEAGAGKTTLIKHLSKIIPDKRFIFVLPDTIAMLRQGAALSKLMEILNDDILVFENAEGIFTDRSQNTSGTAGLMLDITSGLLGEVLGVKVLCTQNTTNNIDPAFLRAGRLLYHHDFKKLSVEQAKEAAKKANRAPEIIETIDKEMALCEIFSLPTTLNPEDVKVEVELLPKDAKHTELTQRNPAESDSFISAL